jgi:hypothetical protein
LNLHSGAVAQSAAQHATPSVKQRTVLKTTKTSKKQTTIIFQHHHITSTVFLFSLSYLCSVHALCDRDDKRPLAAAAANKIEKCTCSQTPINNNNNKRIKQPTTVTLPSPSGVNLCACNKQNQCLVWFSFRILKPCFCFLAAATANVWTSDQTAHSSRHDLHRLKTRNQIRSTKTTTSTQAHHSNKQFAFFSSHLLCMTHFVFDAM